MGSSGSGGVTRKRAVLSNGCEVSLGNAIVARAVASTFLPSCVVTELGLDRREGCAYRRYWIAVNLGGREQPD